MKKKYMLMIFTIVLLVAATVVITVVMVSPKNVIPFVPSESLGVVNEDIISSFPIGQNDMQAYLNSQYFELSDSAFFTLVINDPNNSDNIHFAYYIFRTAEFLNVDISDKTILQYKEHFENYTFDFESLTLDDLAKITYLSGRLNSDTFKGSIIKTLEKQYVENMSLYAYTENEIAERTTISSFGATVQVLNIYEMLNMTCPKADLILQNFSNNIEKYLNEFSAEDDYFNYIFLSQKLGLPNLINNGEILEWLKNLNFNLSSQSDYAPETIYKVFEIAKANQCFSYEQTEVLKYIKKYNFYLFGDHAGFNGVNASNDLLILQIYNICKQNPLINTDISAYINNSIETNFIQKDEPKAQAIYTYYGVSLSDSFGFSYSKSKILNSTRKLFLPYILNKQNITNTNYVIDTYFTVLLVDKLDIEITNDDVRLLADNLNALLSALDLYDLTQTYSNLYTIQFSLEISKMLNFAIDSKETSRIKNYIIYLVNNDICAGSFALIEIGLIYNLLEVDFSATLESQIDSMIEDLSFEGGFSPVSTEKTGDVILSAKIYRLEKCDNISGLSGFLNEFIIDGYLAPNDDITQTDLRFYYSYFKLWLVSKGEFANDFYTTFK